MHAGLSCRALIPEAAAKGLVATSNGAMQKSNQFYSERHYQE